MDKDGRLFSGYEYFLAHNDGDVTLDGIIAEMDGFISRQGIHYTSEEIKEKVEEVENKISHLGMTIDKYRLSGEKNEAIYTQERKKLHDEIVETVVIKRITPEMKTEQPRVMIVLGGRPGSGKTSGFRGLAYDESFIVLDADEIKAMLPEYKGWNAEEVHEESGDILEKCVQACKMNRLNVVIETTMGKADSVLRRIREFHEDGYKVEAHYMFLPMRAAGRRAMERFLNGGENGRYMPVGVLQQMDKTEQNFDIIKPFVDGWSFYSNADRGHHEPPELIAAYGDIYLREKYKEAALAHGNLDMLENIQRMKETVHQSRESDTVQMTKENNTPFNIRFKKEHEK